MNQKLWEVIQTLVEKESIGTSELALAQENLSPQIFSVLAEYFQDGLKEKLNPWV
ncbi:hypothetical protein [Anoxybacillus sp. UARK-01]|jgi:hypothetical protein|uniref:hypothetical protein n=1 Tax=Anoxybacillus sp. UARK-01 TaxID=1895648 RepID=UPI00191BA20E|nr:hypothetical protein [Anoxybacillus sp. UARK-01]